MDDKARAGVRTVEDMVRVPISDIVMLIAVAAAGDPEWPKRAEGVRAHLSENTLNAIREVAKRLNDYANAPLQTASGTRASLQAVVGKGE
jgi:hypothetical protein